MRPEGQWIGEKSTATSKENNRFIRRNFSRYLLPAILSVVAGNISLSVDNLVAGSVLGENALAAMSLAGPVFNIITMIGALICTGASIPASISMGEGNHQRKNQFFTLAFYLVIGVGILLSVLGYFFLDSLVSLLGASGEMVPLVKDYVRVTVLSSVVLMGLYLPVNFLRIAGRVRPTMIMFFIVSILDIAFDYIFTIHFHWGMMGLALATTLSTLIAILCVTPSLASRKTGYALVRIRNSIRDIGRIIVVGSPKASGYLSTIIGVRALNEIILFAGGSMALAAYNCANSVNFISLAIVAGISQTVTPIVGILFGERDKVGIERTVKIAISSGLIITAVFWALMVIFRYPLAALFGLSSPKQMELAGLAIAILNINVFGSLIFTVMGQFFVTTGRVKFINVLTLVKGLVLDIVLALIGAIYWGFTGLLGGFVFSDFVCIFVMIIYACIRKKKENCDNLFLLSSKHFNQGAYLSKVVDSDNASIAETSKLAEKFCREHGLPEKQVHTIGLGIEECMLLMAENSIGKKKKSDKHLELRLFISEYEVVLRIRCFGKLFNPLNYQSEDDEMKFLGIKMLMGLTSDISYTSNMGMNNILIALPRACEQEKL